MPLAAREPCRKWTVTQRLCHVDTLSAARHFDPESHEQSASRPHSRASARRVRPRISVRTDCAMQRRNVICPQPGIVRILAHSRFEGNGHVEEIAPSRYARLFAAWSSGLRAKLRRLPQHIDERYDGGRHAGDGELHLSRHDLRRIAGKSQLYRSEHDIVGQLFRHRSDWRAIRRQHERSLLWAQYRANLYRCVRHPWDLHGNSVASREHGRGIRGDDVWAL